MSDLIKEIKDKTELLDKAVTEVKKRGYEMAMTERDYRVALQVEILKLRTEKVPVTIIGDLARGKPEIAELKFKRDVADSLFKSAFEAINIYKLQLKLIEGQVEREWGSAK